MFKANPALEQTVKETAKKKDIFIKADQGFTVTYDNRQSISLVMIDLIPLQEVYNKLHRRSGYFWGEKFKSVIVEDGDMLINCLAYIDINPVRANMVERPEDYRWSSIGYHVQSSNKDGFLYTDFGLNEFYAVYCK